MTKGLLIAVLVVSAVLIGDILMVVTGNGIVANWGSIIIPSFLVGIMAKYMLKNNEINKFSKIIAAFMFFVKLIILFISVDSLTVLAVVLIIFIYYFIAYLFFILGEKVVELSKR